MERTIASPSPSPPTVPREPRVGLPKAVENVGQKGRVDAASVIGDDQLHARLLAPHPHLHPATRAA